MDEKLEGLYDGAKGVLDTLDMFEDALSDMNESGDLDDYEAGLGLPLGTYLESSVVNMRAMFRQMLCMVRDAEQVWENDDENEEEL